MGRAKSLILLALFRFSTRYESEKADLPFTSDLQILDGTGA